MKHRIPRILVALLVLSLLGGLCIPTLAQNLPEMSGPVEEPIDPNAPPSTATHPEEASAQLPAIEAAETLRATFETDRHGEAVYPNDLAGIWLEGGTLVLSLTTDDEAVRTRYAERTGNPTIVRFETAAIPYNHLRAYQDEATRLVLAAGLRHYTTSSDQQRNRVCLEVAAEDIPAVWDVLHRDITPATFWGTGIPLLRIDDVFEVLPGEPAQLE